MGSPAKRAGDPTELADGLEGDVQGPDTVIDDVKSLGVGERFHIGIHRRLSADRGGADRPQIVRRGVAVHGERLGAPGSRKLQRHVTDAARPADHQHLFPSLHVHDVHHTLPGGDHGKRQRGGFAHRKIGRLFRQ
ncbi:hypothetical protein G6F22_020276 [Rhizopus arrhizus]|nr:hypothetical protein G6F22_020276 [Rhizopus arrhizus]